MSSQMFESGHIGVVIIYVRFGVAIAAEKAGIGRSGYFTINTRFPDAYCQLTWIAFLARPLWANSSPADDAVATRNKWEKRNT